MFGTAQTNQGGGLFGNPNQNTPAGGGLFGNNTQAQGGSMFGAPQNKSFGSTGGGLFSGNANQQTPVAGGGLFGATQPQQQTGAGLFGGGQQQTTGGIFGGGNPQQQGGGLFGGQQQQQQSPFGAPKPAGLFGGNTTQPQQTGGGLFGAQTTPAQGGGLFGQQTQPAQTGAGLFGQQQPQQGGGLFGGAQGQQTGGFGQGQQAGGFGQGQQTGGFGQGQQTGGFGQGQQTGGFGQGQQQSPGGLFGQTPQQQTGGIFGGGQQQTGSSLFGGQPQQTQPQGGALFGQNTQQGGGLFGGNQQKPAGLFGGTQTQQATGGSLFGQPAQSTGGMFGTPQAQQSTSAWGQPQQQQTTTTPSWGGQSTLFGAGTSTQPQTNQLGGTSWGVNTAAFGQTQTNTMASQQPTVTPVKSKNPKVDGKHLVKCIAALDQYTGMSKQQIRCHFLLTGGTQPPIIPQLANTFGQQPNTGGLWNKPTTPQANTSFGQIGAPTTTNSLFGGAQTNQPNTSLFGAKPTGSLFGTTQPQQQAGSSLFGGQPAQQGGSLFGAQQPQQQTGSLFGTPSTPSAFGQPQQQGGSLFGQTQPQGGSMFGQPQQQQTGGLFGTQPAQQGSLFGGSQPVQQQGSLFGQPAQNTGSLFGGSQPQQQTGSLFGASQPQQSNLFGQPQTTGGLFGSNPQQGSSLFGNQPQQQTGSLFGGQPQNGSMFGTASQPQQGGSLFGASQGGLFGAQTAQAPSAYANNFNMLTSIPLQSTLLSNESILDPNYNNQGNNVLAVVLSALVNSGAIRQQDADKLIRPTPFDELVKKRQKELQKQERQEELFSDIPSVFDDPLNFRKFDIPDDYFEMRRSAKYWANQKEKEESDKKKFTMVQIPKKKKQTPLATPFREDDDVANIVRTKKATEADLPTTEKYTLKPSLLRLSKMTVSELKQVEDVEIMSDFGKIKFLQPVSLLYKDIDNCVDIMQDTIDITEADWQNKKCELTFYNFACYSEKSEREQAKIQDKMYKWIKKNQEDQMEFVHFDQEEGTLVVTIH